MDIEDLEHHNLVKKKYFYEKELDVYIGKEIGKILDYNELIDKNGYKTYSNIDKKKVVGRYIPEEWNEILIKINFLKKDKNFSKEEKDTYR